MKLQRELLLNAILAFSVLEFILIPLAGHLSDRIGRKRMYLIGAGITFIVSFLFFWLLGMATPVSVFVAVLLGAVAHSAVYGPQAALIAEQFTPRLRYSGASIGYQLASIIAGGPAPLIAAWLLATYRSGTVIAVYMACCALVGFIAAVFMKDYAGEDVSREYALRERRPSSKP